MYIYATYLVSVCFTLIPKLSCSN
uniref:Uncharacterized protein n=1 Tax=Arundo donax TaxID=35708 RepID=A0A0A9C1L3_ARUDO